MSDLESFASKVRTDTARAAQLKRAVDWLDAGDNQARVREAGVSVGTKIGSGVAGYSDAMTLINDKLLGDLPATLAAVRAEAAIELRAIEERYEPLMSQGGDA